MGWENQCGSKKEAPYSRPDLPSKGLQKVSLLWALTYDVIDSSFTDLLVLERAWDSQWSTL